MVRPSTPATISYLLVCVIMLLLHGRGAIAFQRLVGRGLPGSGARETARRVERGSFVHRIMVPSTLGGTASVNGGPSPGRYEHEAIEPKWQKYWEDKKTFKVRFPTSWTHENRDDYAFCVAFEDGRLCRLSMEGGLQAPTLTVDVYAPISLFPPSHSFNRQYGDQARARSMC